MNLNIESCYEHQNSLCNLEDEIISDQIFYLVIIFIKQKERLYEKFGYADEKG